VKENAVEHRVRGTEPGIGIDFAANSAKVILSMGFSGFLTHLETRL
jgi:hypothetical protein